MGDLILIFVLTKYNRNSIAALAGALEGCAALSELPVRFLWDQPDLVTQICRAISGYKRAVIAFSFATAYREHVADSILLLKRSLADYPGRILYLAGGPHPTGDPLATLRMGFDIVVRGEGEETFPALLIRLITGDDLGGLAGLVYQVAENIIWTDPAPPVDIERYPPFSLKYDRWGFIEISRGCPWACQYCQTSQLNGTRMRHRSVEHVAKAIRDVMPRGFSYARFITPDAFAYGSPDGYTVNLAAIEALLQAVNALVGKEQTYFGSFPSEVRPNTVSPETVALVRRFAANRGLLLGAQSGSPRMLKLMHRGHTVEDVYRAVQCILSGGLTPIVDFIFGLPGETEEDRQQTIRVIRDLAGQGAIIHGHAFMPLPGTPWADQPPGRIAPEIESLLGYLGRRGQHFGTWGRQQRLAQPKAT